MIEKIKLLCPRCFQLFQMNVFLFQLDTNELIDIVNFILKNPKISKIYQIRE